jgi:adenylate cyclase
VSPRGIQPSPHDLVYALNRVLAVVSQAVLAHGGRHGSHDNDGAGALFGLDVTLPAALAQAWQAAARVERELLALNARLVTELGIEARFAMALHAGTAAIGPLHWGNEHARLPVGPAVCDAMALRDLAAARGARLAVSRAAAAASPWPVDALTWQALAAPEGHAGTPLQAALLPTVSPATSPQAGSA